MNKEPEVWPDGWNRQQICVAENLIMFSCSHENSYEDRKRYVVRQLIHFNHFSNKKDGDICE